MNERELFRETFSRMHASDDLLEEVLDMNEHGKKGKRFVKKSTVIGIAAAAMGTVAMAAAAHQWSRGMLNHLQGTTEQMQQLEEKEMASFPELSVTDEGVTVSVQQCIVNGAWGIVDLKVSGYDLPEGKEPNFQTADLEVKDWGGSWSISGQFDDGLLTDGYRVIERRAGDRNRRGWFSGSVLAGRERGSGKEREQNISGRKSTYLPTTGTTGRMQRSGVLPGQNTAINTLNRRNKLITGHI